MIRVKSTCLNLIDTSLINVYFYSIKNKLRILFNLTLKSSQFFIDLLLKSIYCNMHNPYPDKRYLFVYKHNWYDNLN